MNFGIVSFRTGTTLIVSWCPVMSGLQQCIEIALSASKGARFRVRQVLARSLQTLS